MIGEMTALGTGTFDPASAVKPADTTKLVIQTADGKKPVVHNGRNTESRDCIPVCDGRRHRWQ